MANGRMTAHPAHLKLLQIEWWLCEFMILEVTQTNPSVRTYLCFMVIDEEIFCSLYVEVRSPPEVHFLL